jgi:DNA-binding NarL/FixJ family response regulator
MIRIMIVDDQSVIREGLKMILKLNKEFSVVCEAENGFEALEMLNSHIIDVVLTDIRMPKMDGLEIAKRIRKLYPNIKIIFLTVFNEKEYLLKGLQYGINGYLLKDSSAEDIIRSIKEAVNNNILIDPEAAATLVNILEKNHSSNSDIKDIETLLTDREIEICRLVCEGKRNKEISDILFISEGTVKNYMSKILKKVELTSRTQLSLFFSNLNNS